MSLKTTLNALGDAIRGKAGVTGALTLQQMADAVNGISVGVDTSDATAAASDILSGKTAYAGGVKVTGTIPSKAASTITPGTADQTIAAGRYLTGAQTVKGDANLLAENIAKGVSIFGVTGTHAGIGDMLYASGSVSYSATASNTFTVTGLEFKPVFAVYSLVSKTNTYGMICVVLSPNYAKWHYTRNSSSIANGTPTWSFADDGFTFSFSYSDVRMQYSGANIEWVAYGM